MNDYIYCDPGTVNKKNMVYTYSICANPTPFGYTNMSRIRPPPVFKDQDDNIIPFTPSNADYDPKNPPITFAWVYKSRMWMWVGTRKDANGCTIPEEGATWTPTFDEEFNYA